MSARRLFRWLLLALLALTLPTLEGCGRKPKLLDPPEGSGPEAAKFPHSYPSPKYDPKGQESPVQPGPLVPDNPYPTLIRPSDGFGPSSIAMPAPNAAWATPSTRPQP